MIEAQPRRRFSDANASPFADSQAPCRQLPTTIDSVSVSHARFAATPAVLADIYQPQVNFAVWRAGLSPAIEQEAQQLIQCARPLSLTLSGAPDALRAELQQRLRATMNAPACVERIDFCLKLYADLFEPPAVGLRLEMLDRAMCPRFHVDRLSARLVTTLFGPATQWLPNHAADRALLGPAGMNQQDEKSGLVRDVDQIQALEAGDVALMKGEGWDGNDGHGLIHRSPAVSPMERRLVLTLDWVA